MSLLLPFFTTPRQNATSNCADSQTLDAVDAANLHQTQKPPMYKILMLNDDFTPMDFVVYILENIFFKSNEDAVNIMFEVHNTGFGNCGVFTYEIAESKKAQVIKTATKYQYPLQCVLEKE